MRKFTFPRRCLTVFIIISMFNLLVFSQTETYSVPADWQLYFAADKKVSFSMPRRPIRIDDFGRQCQGEDAREYAAYNDGAVFVLRIASKTEPGKSCLEKKDFDENNFKARVSFWRSQLAADANSENNISADSVIKLSGNESVVKLVNDYENKRWIELSIHGADENKPEAKNFLSSLKTDKNATGIEIGEGAPRTFGDDAARSIVEEQVKTNETVETVKRMLVKTADPSEKGIRVVLKERARYTDAARQANVRGKVVLRVTFQANGAVGAISVVSGLTDGLTEEAVKAAQKIVFIPAQRNGSRYSVTRPVEYSFTIY